VDDVESMMAMLGIREEDLGDVSSLRRKEGNPCTSVNSGCGWNLGLGLYVYLLELGSSR
jgi:hypothetical protein